MANENDEVQQHQQQQNSNNGDVETNNASAVDGQQQKQQHQQQQQSDEHKDKDGTPQPLPLDVTGADKSMMAAAATCARGKLNDLVADLCGKGAAPTSRSTFGDYTNIRATLGQLDLGVDNTSAPSGYKQQSHEQSSSILPTASPVGGFVSQTTAPQPAQNSSFSFKHFLNSSSSSITAPSTTVTSLSASSLSGHGSNNASLAATVSSSSSLQTSTGARPKVPQSASASTSSISTLVSGLSVGGGGSSGSGTQSGFAISATKMKRSPRFSSFDSQASLAEYAATGVDSANIDGLDNECAIGGSGGGGSNTGHTLGSGFRLYPDTFTAENNDIFCSRNMSGGGVSTSNYERQYVPRSYSNYDNYTPASPRRRGNAAKDARPTRLSLNTNSSKLKLDLPIDDLTTGIGVGGGVGSSSSSARPLPINASGSEFPPGAATLPDFVQDHWMESWYAHEMHLNSPPNSPIRDFVDDITGGAATAGGCGAGCGSSGSVGVAIPTNNGDGIPTAVGGTSDAAKSSKMLPDFLSDGPIIHSSQRLADVAAGLPSNSIGSPEDTPMTSQLSRIRMENERLQRELAEARTALIEQTRRGNELERQLQERQRTEPVSVAFNCNAASNVPFNDEQNVDRSKRRITTASTQNHISKLKQQVTLLTAEVDTLRRENETLREEGAVGGCGAGSTAMGATATANTTAAGAANAATATVSSPSYGIGARAMLGRPSRAHQISRDLLRAAANAESNLRQLLTGVDNLRQMAADIENSESRLDLSGLSPDFNSDFLDECDDYEDYQGGGPAL